MVEHNYRRFLTLGQQTKQEFENITGVDIDQAVSSFDPQSNRW
jgi:hypothetical protein